MAELKTKPTNASVEAFINAVADESRRRDCLTVSDMMKKATGSDPQMWGPSIVGFGTCHLKYASGRELDWFTIGFSPRKNDLTLYIMPGLEPFQSLLPKLGKFKTGKCCLYIKRLDDINTAVLQKMISESIECMKQSPPGKNNASEGRKKERPVKKK